MDIIRRMAELIETNGHFLMQMRKPRGKNGAYPQIELTLQFEEEDLARAVGQSQRKKVYEYHGCWSVYFSGQKMMLWLAAGRDYFCPAHRRFVTGVLQLFEMNRKRKVLGRAWVTRRGAMREGIERKNESIGHARARLFEEAVEDYDRLLVECPMWVALEPPRQLRVHESVNKPEPTNRQIESFVIEDVV